MSFLTRFTPLTARVASTPAIRTTPALGVGAARSISSTARRQSGPVDATKETLKKADRVVSDAAVKGIEKGGMFHVSCDAQLWRHANPA